MMLKPSFSPLIWCAVGAMALGCGGSTGGTGSPDDDSGLTQTDSSSGDTGSNVGETGAPLDSATPSETSPGDDSGTPTDDSSTTDSGTVTDSTVTDSGTTGTDSAVTDSGTTTDTAVTPDTTTTAHVKTVFVIMMENHDWSAIKGSSGAPYINGLLSKASYATNYNTPAGNHPSEPNYIWLEAGDNLKIKDDNDALTNHQSTTDHFVSQLTRAGISWKSYQENYDGATCPLTDNGLYAAKHNPMVFFDDVTDSHSTSSATCKAHVKPYTALATDLAGGSGLARYNFITPNLCNDMHGNISFTDFCASSVTTGDTWLSTEVPKIMDSAAYKDNGALFIIWDEGTAPILGTSSDGPIGMILLSPLAKGGGYNNAIKYTHSSTLKTFERIFGVPYLRDAATATTTDLSDLFVAGALP